jgi:Zn-dependent protease
VEDLLQKVAVWAVPVVVAVILHEVSHGAVAYALGDPTARDAGRLTLNPIPHIDPFGTLLLPGLLIFIGSPFVFGYARPVPVSFGRLRSPKRDMILVAAAGPLTNLTLATLSSVLLHIVGPDAGLLTSVLFASVLINVVLAVFNLIPIPPLDGSRVLTGLLPLPLARLYVRLEPFGMLLVIILLASRRLDDLIGPVVDVLLHALL